MGYYLKKLTVKAVSTSLHGKQSW